MKNIRLLLLGLIIAGCSSEIKIDPVHKIFFEDQIYMNGEYLLLESFTLNIDNDKILDTIKLFHNPYWTDPGDFLKIEIKLSNNDLYEIFNLGDWNNMNKHQLDKFKNINKINTNRFLITDLSERRTVLIIFGWQYASSPGKITIIDLTNGKIKILFDKNFEINSIEDINNNNNKEIIGLLYYGVGCCYNDSISHGVSYVPFHVLAVEEDTIRAVVELSEDYNHENYLGFFGLEYDSDMRYLIITPRSESRFKPYFHFEKYRNYPETSLRYLNKEELESIPKEELRFIRNEIFAFHGYQFKSEDLNEYFSKQNWYKPSNKDINSRLNKYERANIDLIIEFENK